jgi:hypothetical protein
MNRFVTRDDLTRILDNATCLAKLAETAQCISGDLSAGKRDTRDVREAIKRCHKRLGEKDLTKKQRAKLERKLQFYDEWLYHTGIEIEKKNAAFSDAVIRIETELRELAQVHEALAHVHRFEHRLSHDRPQARRPHKPVGR